MRIRGLLLFSQLAIPAFSLSLDYPRRVQDVLGATKGFPDLWTIPDIIFNAMEGGGNSEESTVRALMEVDDGRVWEEEGERYVEGSEAIYRVVSDPTIHGYQLRITEHRTKSTDICDNTPGVDGVSGYMDVSSGKHLFFWFYKTRASNPSSKPLIMFLNGGPGCSSSSALTWGPGPCRIKENGVDSAYPHSWLTFSNMIFLDQPANVGYSFGPNVTNSADAGKDVATFMKLFMKAFPVVKDCHFHLAGQSYAGTYIPHIATEIQKHKSSNGIKLRSLIFGNGITDPLSQYPYYPDFACDGPHQFLNSTQCAAMREKLPICKRKLEACYDGESDEVCSAAQTFCSSVIVNPVLRTDRNQYDVRKACNRAENGPGCYTESKWIESWMNKSETRREFGADPDRGYTLCNRTIYTMFRLSGDGAKNHSKLLPALLNADIRILSYAGNTDFVCPHNGIEAWMLKLENKYKADFVASRSTDWTFKGRVAAKIRTAGGDPSQFGSYAYAEIPDAGHMVGADQPEVLQELINKWVANRPLGGGETR